MKVSIFQNFNEITENKEIVEVLTDIKTGKYKNVITYLRKSLADSKMEAYERAKKSLPAFTPSACFKGGRKQEFITAYTQIVVLDIDKISSEQLAQSKEKLCKGQYTFSAFTSPSGNGLKILVKVNSSQENHKEAFLKLQKYYEKLLALPIDKSGKDVTRLCFVSYDTDLFLNENASIFPIISTEDLRPYFEQNSEATNEHTTIASNGFATEKFSNDYLPLYEHCVRFTEKKESYINGNRNNFVHLLACNLNRKGVPLPTAIGYILSDYNYDAQEVTATVNSAYKNVVEHNKSNLSNLPKGEISEQSSGNKSSEDDSEEEEEKPSFIDRLLQYGFTSREFLLQVAPIGTRVTILTEVKNELDYWKRQLGYVILPSEECLNELLLANGYAKASHNYYCSMLSEYQLLNRQAQMQKAGLYAFVERF